jgi:thioesterase domain-containing protein/acyl carrier protein
MSDLISTPESPLEKTLANYWKDVLNMDEVGIDDNFFDLGGTSLMAIRCVTQMNKEHDFKLAVSSIYEFYTIRQLANKIEHADTNDLSSVLLLKEGQGTPLFIFPPWSSYPTIFSEFVETYKGDNPLYGIIYTEDSDDFPFSDLQEYAEFLIDNIKKHHPIGPYGLLGCSMGARTILEVAVQLQKQGDKVDFFGAVSHYPSYPARNLVLNRKLRDEVRIFANISLQFKLKYLRHRLPYFLKLLLTGDNKVQEIIIENGAQNQILAIHESYIPSESYNGDLVLIYETSPEGLRSELKKSQVYRNSILKILWKKYIKGSVIVKIIDCKHNDFFKKPTVEEITSIAHSYLQKTT